MWSFLFSHPSHFVIPVAVSSSFINQCSTKIFFSLFLMIFPICRFCFDPNVIHSFLLPSSVTLDHFILITCSLYLPVFSCRCTSLLLWFLITSSLTSLNHFAFFPLLDRPLYFFSCCQVINLSPFTS